MKKGKKGMGMAAFLLVAVLVGVGLFLLVQNGRATSTGERSAVASWPSSPEEQEAEFWKIIETNIGSARSEAEQLVELRRQLGTLSTGDLESFIRVYDRLMARTYTWDLWGAAYVAQGGASDDGFEDFRKWLISKGRVAFESVEANPDNLADIIPAGYEGDASFEEFSYLFADIWTERTGRPLTALVKEKESLYPSEPRGDQFEEDVGHLAARYPKLWSRFGDAPLQ